MDSILIKKLLIWLLLTVNLLFAFIIGLTIPIMESKNSNLLGFVMIPLLVIANYIILDRFHYFLKHENDKREDSNEKQV